MTYKEAVDILANQEKRIKKVDGFRFTQGKYDYRVRYEGGFASFVSIERREAGRRKYVYFTGFGAHDCATAEDVLKRVKAEVDKSEVA